MRNRFDTALVQMLHAPAMEIPGLNSGDPVPLYISDGHDCMIRKMTLLVALDGANTKVSGAGQWSWAGEHRLNDMQFSAEHRLAEPAFIRGIDLSDSNRSIAHGKYESKSTSEHEVAEFDVELHVRLVDSCIVKGVAEATGHTVFIKPFESGLCNLKESIFQLVFEDKHNQKSMLYDLLNE